jgi:hypothetical protein
MRTFFATAMAIAMLAGPAHAFDMTPDSKDPLQLKYEREEQEKKDIERDYNAQMKRLKAQAPTTTKKDPWAGVRSTSSEKR